VSSVAHHDWAYTVAVTIPITVTESVSVAITIIVPIAVAVTKSPIVIIVIEAARPPDAIISVEELSTDAPDLLDHTELVLCHLDAVRAAKTHCIGADRPRAEHRRGGQCRKQELVHFESLLLVVIAGLPASLVARHPHALPPVNPIVGIE
jgi:hypothetical protein